MKYGVILAFCSALAACGGGEGGGSGAASVPDSFAPDCTGAGCGAVNASTYSGSGTGIWRYDNNTASAATININLGGVTAGKTATLIFSNGSNALTTLPSSGVLASPVVSAAAVADAGVSDAALAALQSDDDAHAQMLEKSQAVAAALIRTRPASAVANELMSTNSAAVSRVSFAPAIGASRLWNDNFATPSVAYATAVQSVCTLPSGRHVVWWVDPAIVSSGQFTASALSAALGAMQTSYCGSSGGLTRLTALLGDVWGSAASAYSDVIQDTPTLQDINVVLLNVPASAAWAGYFYGGNNLLTAKESSSNEALAFFINASQMKLDLNFAISTLLHESTHMVNFYQRAVARGVSHDTWLEETSAMMTEDIIAPAVIGGYNKTINLRLPAYLASGGGVNYMTWPTTLTDSSSHYAMGGGLGAFLNRRYGLPIYQQLVTSCRDGISTSTSYACLDALIKANGGAGFKDEFARFGATVFGQLPAVGVPAGYGYPAVTAGAYALQAKNLSLLSATVPAPLSFGYMATSQTFQRDIIAPGKTSYVRSGVVVPANTSLRVVIQ